MNGHLGGGFCNRRVVQIDFAAGKIHLMNGGPAQSVRLDKL